MFSNDGKFIKQLVKPDTLFARNLALSSDPEQQFLYVGDGKEIAILDRKSLDQVGTIKVPGLIGGGHPVGGTGVRQVLDSYRQVTDTAGGYQVEGARRVATLNLGGSATTSVSFVVGTEGG